MKYYRPPEEELLADAKFIQRGFVRATMLRCDNCGKRQTYATDTEVDKNKNPIYPLCTCGQDPIYWKNEMVDLTFGDVAEAWKEVFGDMFPLDNKQHSYVFDRFIQGLAVKQYRKQEFKKISKETKMFSENVKKEKAQKDIEAGKGVKKK